MHRHIVLFNLKEDADAAAVIGTMQGLADLPTVESFMVAENALEPGDTAPYKWIMVGDFADQAARDAYEAHETHVDIIRNAFLPAVANYIIADANV